ncbi:tyrosine-type recombinase/integrase [Anaerolineales bacterium HSG6]|nr:tyrosine-type recombinase/integrase [Anaerolineales bacterium HSG6]MDM8531203.1 tyrosine-type recombinase/integrase [Anaerolineales bacterium HSG25]
MKRRISDFLQFLKLEKGYSDNTVVAYQNDLFQFLEHITSKKDDTGIKSWSEVDKTLLTNYISYLKTNKAYSYSSSTIARKVAAVKSFFHFLVAEKEIDHDPTKELDSPKVEKRSPKSLTPLEVDRLLRAPINDANTPKSQRDLALLEMLYGSGMRVTELVSLDTTDLNLGRDNGQVRVQGKKKNALSRDIPLNGPVLEALRYYVEHGRQQLVQSSVEMALFVNNRGRRLTRQGLWLIIKQYVKAVGISTHVTPHTLRHSFAAHKLSQGKSLQDIQQLLGHANISTTQMYTQNETDKEVVFDSKL